VVERVVLRPLINRPPLTLFMATLGLSFVIEGLSQFLMGASVHELDLGIVDVPIQIGPILVSQLDLVAAASAGVLVLALSLLFSRTRIGISLRAIADDPQAALSIGVRLPRLWRIVWGVAGVVSIVAGLLWGARQGVQFALTLVVLKDFLSSSSAVLPRWAALLRVVSSSVPAKTWRRSISVRSWAAVFPTGSRTPSHSRFS
jgi:branched-chain amino acid transport system permease protein